MQKAGEIIKKTKVAVYCAQVRENEQVIKAVMS